jgi:hypothetical protein
MLAFWVLLFEKQLSNLPENLKFKVFKRQADGWPVLRRKI